jgi:hypothetical protein
MDNKDIKVFKWVHKYLNGIINITNEIELKKLDVIHRELLIRNMVMSITSPNLFNYVLKNKI